MDDLIAAARTWAQNDPDPATRAEAQALVDDGDADALAEAFGARLQFGTAGLRGRMGAGPNRMNGVMVRRVTQGLADYLRAAGRDHVVIGFDGRHNSRAFAGDAAAVLERAGVRVTLASDLVPTPLLSYATVALGAAAGVMVTASHNPPADNGYKVYRANGAQIIPPDDRQISDAIDRAPEFVSPGEAVAAAAIPDGVVDAYFTAIQRLRVHRDVGARVVYSAMHGVGGQAVLRALREGGHTDVHVVAEQFEPDGDFPTVAFPNPEEPGALDLAIAQASAVDADVILANDPDADRLAVAVRDRQGVWRQLTGNQLGVVLADDLLRHGDFGGKEPMVAMSIVSTAMLRPIAVAHGAAYAETLTGFKWIGHRAIAHEQAGGAFCFGFEEALGYTAGSVVRDKDGVSTALLVVDLVSWLKLHGRTLFDALDDLYRTHGVYVSGQHSLKLEGADGLARVGFILERLRAAPPDEIDGVEVVSMLDLAACLERRRDGTVHAVDLPSSDVLAFNLADGSRVLVRPSGTEPKMKFYFELREAMRAGEEVAVAWARGEARMAAAKAAVLARAGV